LANTIQMVKNCRDIFDMLGSVGTCGSTLLTLTVLCM